jgi:hypothetical protein
MNSLVAIVLLAWSMSSSQEQGTAGRAPAACGPASVSFDVKNDGASHPTAPPDPDKAVVYVVENLRAGCFMCDTTVKLGLDGSWVAATKANSYAFFSVEPGDRHVCAALQAGNPRAETVSLAGFTAEAGKTYYFRARLTDRNNSGKGGVQWALDLDPINSDEGQFLITQYPHSTSHRRK